MTYNPSEIIKKKKWGEELTRSEIEWLIKSYTANKLPDYQMSAFAMAIWFKGMSDKEISFLTQAMKNSGKVFDFSFLNSPRIDKHSTGGVGDKTSLIVGPILAAAKVHVPMIAGRGLGHTGGTLDKLESIPGFKVNLSAAEFVENVAKYHFALMGQTEDICPADKKLYALRDVTSTVDSLPLICASIMSKKLAEDITGLVLDVKFGSGAFMKTPEQAVALAQLLKKTGDDNGVRVAALITNMNEPLGRFVGNSVEIFECLEILSGKNHLENDIDFYQSTRELSLQLSGYMLYLAKKTSTPDEGYDLASQILKNGSALEQFHLFNQRQGRGDLSALPKAKFTIDFLANDSGHLAALDCEKIGLAFRRERRRSAGDHQDGRPALAPDGGGSCYADRNEPD